MDEATVQRLMEAAIRATRDDAHAGVQQLRKPDLPAFDRRNIHIWIKRVEAAYARVGCTDPALKFAHLESKFEVNEDPVVDSYLFGESTSENWQSFLDYLVKRFGKTRKDQTIALLNGFPREGRTPSQLAALIEDKTKDVTLDDVRKQQLLKQLPSEVLKHIVDKVEALDFKATATLADSWFDKEGRPLIGQDATSINQVGRQQPPQHPQQPQPQPQPPAPESTAAAANPFSQLYSSEAEEADVNAIRFRQGQRQQVNVSNRGGRGRPTGHGNSNGNNNPRRGNSGHNTNSYGSSPSYSNGGNNPSSGARPKKVCGFHVRFGEEAQRCESWCMLHPQHQKKMSNGKASQ